jgi:hypothetical protein
VGIEFLRRIPWRSVTARSIADQQVVHDWPHVESSTLGAVALGLHRAA